MSETKEEQIRFPALKVNQWLPEWNSIKTKSDPPRRTPPSHFYLLSLPAHVLRTLSGVEHRKTDNRLQGGQDHNIQRALDKKRVQEIANYVKSGFPWSELPEAKRNDPDYVDLRMPGWLPTAIVINVKRIEDLRDSGAVAENDAVVISEDGQGNCQLILPKSYKTKSWRAEGSLPIEVIDGQHRLFAFDTEVQKNFELPVVAFVGLDISWQAYLFFVINIKPKRINPSLAFDLYPLLRNEDWLAKHHGHQIYRDARSQELTQLMWSLPFSPWHQRINMLGSTGGDSGGQVNQASWVRSLSAAMVKNARAKGRAIGGLFGSEAGYSVPWTRTEQTAFLIFVWQSLEKAVKATGATWAQSLRAANPAENDDSAFAGRLTLLNTDQGVRGFLHVANDLMMVRRSELELDRYSSETPLAEPTPESVQIALQAFEDSGDLAAFVLEVCGGLAEFDWRTSDAPDLTSDQRTLKKAFRGSGGYRELRLRLLDLLAQRGGKAGDAALEVTARLGYEGELD